MKRLCIVNSHFYMFSNTTVNINEKKFHVFVYFLHAMDIISAFILFYFNLLSFAAFDFSPNAISC